MIMHNNENIAINSFVWYKGKISKITNELEDDYVILDNLHKVKISDINLVKIGDRVEFYRLYDLPNRLKNIKSAKITYMKSNGIIGTNKDLSENDGIFYSYFRKYYDLDKLAKKCMKYVTCDTARISRPSNKLFLIIGFNRNTLDDNIVTRKNINGDSNIIYYDYVHEQVIASGYTDKELIKSTKEYTKLSKMTMAEYLRYIKNDAKLSKMTMAEYFKNDKN